MTDEVTLAEYIADLVAVPSDDPHRATFMPSAKYEVLMAMSAEDRALYEEVRRAMERGVMAALTREKQ